MRATRPGRARPRAKTWTFRLLAAALSLAVALLLLELALTARQYLQQGTVSRAGEVAYREAMLRRMRLETEPKKSEAGARRPPAEWEHRLLVHPFYGFVYNAKYPGYNDFGFNTPYEFDIDGQGYRLRNASERPPFAVGIFGGSFAEYVGQHAAYMEELLQAVLPDRTPVVICFGIGGHAMPQANHIFYQFHQLLDAAIFLDGLNEIWNPFENNNLGCPPEYAKAWHYKYILSLHEFSPARFAATAAILNEQRRLAWLTALSLAPVIRRSLTIHELWTRYEERAKVRIGLANKTLKASFDTGTPFRPLPDEELMTFAVSRWRKHHLEAHEFARRAGVLDLHVLQPNPYVSGSKQLTETEQRILDGDDVVRLYAPGGYPRLRAELAALQADGLPAHDLCDIYQAETGEIWIDPAHPNDRGCRLVVEQLAALLRERMPSGPGQD